MAEHIGEWHTLTINDPAETDDVVEVEHPDSCPRREVDEDGFVYTDWACSLAGEIGDYELEHVTGPDGQPLAPGVYRARLCAWSSYSYSYSYGSEDWDAQVEVESLGQA